MSQSGTSALHRLKLGERPTRLARTRRSAGCNIESHTCDFNTVNASANARPLTRLRQPTFVSTPRRTARDLCTRSELTLTLQRHRKTPINHTSCLTSRSGTPALGLTARAPASGTFASIHLCDSRWDLALCCTRCDVQQEAMKGILRGL